MPQNALGQFLVREGIISDSNLVRAMHRAKIKGSSLVSQLVELGLVDEYRVAQAIAEACRLEFVELATAEPPSGDAPKRLSVELARRFHVVPLWYSDNILTVGVANPLDRDLAEVLQRECKCRVECVVVRDSAVSTLLESLYADTSQGGCYDRLLKDAELSRDCALNVVKAMLAAAIQVGGDIHVLPHEQAWQACLCVDDEVDELFRVSPAQYVAIADIFKSFLPRGSVEGGEFKVHTSNHEEVTFFLDIDADHHGEQLFVCLLERELVQELQDVTIDLELPSDVVVELESASREHGLCIGTLIQKAWNLTRDVVNTACVCPYTAPKQEKRATTVRLPREVLSDIEATATQNDRTREWVVMKVLLMARECIMRGSKSKAS